MKPISTLIVLTYLFCFIMSLGKRLDNIDILAEAIGMDLEVIEVESEVSEFRADIIARDLSGEDRIVVIESQLSRTNHEHLGKTIIYAAERNASAVVWISPEFKKSIGVLWTS